MSGCGQLIAEEIRQRGPISFARFMELALYAEGCGYYTSGMMRVGRAGDFLTNVSMGEAWGLVVAHHCLAAWRAMGRPSEFRIVEQGAHDGQLAADILEALKQLCGEVRFQYQIIESSESQRRMQEERLRERGVKWWRSLEEAAPIVGIHISNELVDALPFHIIRACRQGWCELLVDEAGGEFVFVSGALSEEILPMVEKLPGRPEGYMAEVRPAVVRWIRQVADALRMGYVLVMDYGMSRDQLLHPSRMRGTFAAYEGHLRDEMVLAKPGERDITAHVDFTSLAEAARKAGLVIDGLADQHHFVVRELEGWLRGHDGQPAGRLMRQVAALMHPAMMGSKFFAMGLRTAEVPALTKFFNREVGRGEIDG